MNNIIQLIKTRNYYNQCVEIDKYISQKTYGEADKMLERLILNGYKFADIYRRYVYVNIYLKNLPKAAEITEINFDYLPQYRRRLYQCRVH